MTNNKKDFIFYHLIQSNIHLDVGSTAQCEGIGAVLTRLTPTTTPILLAPVYFYPSAKISTLSPSALKHYNTFIDLTIKVHDLLDFKPSQHDREATINVTVHNNLNYLDLPALHLSLDTITNPTMASLFKSGTNEQFIQKKFDHCSLDMVLKIKKRII